MRDNVLYFPYIAVPNSEWLTQVLLYWDQLYSIVPTNYEFDPNGTFTQELLHSRLLSRLHPGDYLHVYPGFQKAFIDCVLRNRPAMERRLQSAFARPHPIPIHAEKMQDIGEQLVELGLAKASDRPSWYVVDSWVANYFMTFLAVGLATIPALDAAPITDDQACFQLLQNPDRFPNTGSDRRRLETRLTILRQILPVPAGGIRLNELAEFKRRQGDRLRLFRQRVERECIDIGNIANHANRRERLALAIEDLRAEREQIRERMNARWPNLILGSVASILWAVLPLLNVDGPAAATYVGAGAGFTGAIYTAFLSEKDYRRALNSPLAYAAFFQKSVPAHFR